jgi:hypothetical protein
MFSTLFHEVKIEELPQQAFAHSCWDVFQTFYSLDTFPYDA